MTIRWLDGNNYLRHTPPELQAEVERWAYDQFGAAGLTDVAAVGIPDGIAQVAQKGEFWVRRYMRNDAGERYIENVEDATDDTLAATEVRTFPFPFAPPMRLALVIDLWGVDQ